MKRFLSMLAMAVLVLQSVATSAVYATDLANQNEESDSVPAVETVVVDEDADDGSNNEVTTNLNNSEENVSDSVENDDETEGEEGDTSVTETSNEEATPVVEETSAVEESPVVEESKVDSDEEEDVEESDFQPLFGLKASFAPVLFSEAVESSEAEADFDEFIEKWNNTKSCDDVEDEAGCVDNPQQSSVEIAPGEDLNAGEVGMWKLVQPTDNPGEYEISIAVKGQPVEEEVYKDVCSVVVFDKSYSMGDECSYNCDTRYNYQGYNYGDKRNNAMNGAISFSNNLISQVPDSKIGLVTFAKTATISVQLQTGSLIEGDFGNLDASTNIHAGLMKAKDVLENCSDDAKKYIVLISDGEPNYALDKNGKNYTCGSKCGQRTQEYAEILKTEEGIIIYSIGYETNSTADGILKGISNGDGYFYTGDTSSIAQAFKEIADTVTNDAGKDAHVDDKLGATVTISNEGEDSYDIGNITKAGHVHTFTVKIDPTIEGNQETNAGAILTYKDVDGNPATGNIDTSASVNWVLPSCGGDKPSQVDGISFGADKFTQSWGDDGKLTPETKNWTYTDSTTLESCEWTCDTANGYVRNGNTCELAKYDVIIDPNCAEGESCETVTTGDVEHGTKITLPTLERKYTLTYEENEKVENKLGPVTVEATLLGYCKNAKTCESPIAVGKEVEVTDDVTYYAVWDETPLTVSLVDGAGYTTPEYKYSFKEWENGKETVNGSITLIKDETLVAQYTSEAQEYKVTYKVDGEVYGEVETVAYGTELTAREEPTKTGYTFGGWSEIPATMPAEDVVIEGTFSVNSYKVTYKVDGEVYGEVETVAYGTELTAREEPTKTGYTFGGWSEIPATMPAEDVVVEGTFRANTDTEYTVEYYLQNVEGTDYVLDKERTENKAGTTDTEASVTPEEIVGFTLNNEESTLTGIISADEKLVLKVYYDRVESSITIDPNCEDENEVCDITTETGSYEKEVTLPRGMRSYTLSYNVGENPTTVDSQTVTATIIGYCKGESDSCEESERIPVGTNVNIEAEPVTYTAVWSNDMTVTVADGSDYQTDSTVYTFRTWIDGKTEVNPQSTVILTSDKELVAEYESNARTYMIIFVDEDNETQLQSGEVAYGETPKYNGETPTKIGETGYVYTFAGWNPEIAVVTGDATYTATYTESCDTGYHYEGLEGATDKMCVENQKEDSCTMPANADNNANYTTTGTAEWNGEWIAATCEFIECKDDYHQEKEGGACILNEKEDACELPEGYDVNANYTTTGTAEWNGEWIAATCEFVECKDNYHEVTSEEGAKSCELNTYTITWNNDDNTLIDTTTVEHGDMPTHADAIKEATGYVYTFAGWTPEIVVATGDATYTATYIESCAEGYHDQSLENSDNETGDGENIGRIDFATITIDQPTNYDNVNEEGNTATAGLVCVPNTKIENCAEGKVANGTYTVTGVETKWNENENKWNDTEACEFTCNNGYHLNANKDACEKDSNGGGGGGGGNSGGGKTEDDCPNGDNSGDLYDGTCDAPKTPEEPGGNNGGGDDEEIELGGQVSDKCSVEGTNRSEEEIAAYLYACENDITTIRDIESARLGDFLTRAEMAKMISVFATKELGMKPNTSKDCSNFADSIASYNQEMKDYMVMACQLEIMGIHTTNYEPIPDFMPNKRVSRAEFGTVLSRILWGNKYEGTNSNYYINHLNALKENDIITNVNPNITEYRAWVFLMLYRSVEAIKVMRTNTDETVEEQVNEELQEEGKAETGLVVEYDSGSVVPEIATETESGTLATGSVAEIETGSVVEAETGDTASLTGDDISKEVSAETGSVAETETGSTSD